MSDWGARDGTGEDEKEEEENKHAVVKSPPEPRGSSSHTRRRRTGGSGERSPSRLVRVHAEGMPETHERVRERYLVSPRPPVGTSRSALLYSASLPGSPRRKETKLAQGRKSCPRMYVRMYVCVSVQVCGVFPMESKGYWGRDGSNFF